MENEKLDNFDKITLEIESLKAEIENLKKQIDKINKSNKENI